MTIENLKQIAIKYATTKGSRVPLAPDELCNAVVQYMNSFFGVMTDIHTIKVAVTEDSGNIVFTITGNTYDGKPITPIVITVDHNDFVTNQEFEEFKTTTNAAIQKNTESINSLSFRVEDTENDINSFKNMSYILLDDNYENKLERIVTKTFDKDTFVVSTPVLNGGSLVGIKSIEKTSLDDNLNYASKLLKNLNKGNINNLFRESYDKDSIVVDEQQIDKGYISVIGTHYGKVTLAPAIAKMLCDTISSSLNCKLKKNFIDKRREFYRFREMNRNEINEVIKLDKRYGKIICMCNNVSEGEIVDSIRRPLGARTVKGVKRRTGAGFGNCHGSYCNERIIQILARELDKKITDIVDDSKNSNIISGRIKEFKEI